MLRIAVAGEAGVGAKKGPNDEKYLRHRANSTFALISANDRERSMETAPMVIMMGEVVDSFSSSQICRALERAQ